LLLFGALRDKDGFFSKRYNANFQKRNKTMFGEILNLAKFIREIIVERSDKVKGWKKVYSLYCSLERVIDRISPRCVQSTIN
jgi:hypothetical protein